MQASTHPFDAVKDILTTLLLVDSLAMVVAYQIITSMDVSSFKEYDTTFASSVGCTSCSQMVLSLALVSFTMISIVLNILSQLAMYTMSVVAKVSTKILITIIMTNTVLTISTILGTNFVIVKVFDVKFPLYSGNCMGDYTLSSQIIEGYWNGTMLSVTNQFTILLTSAIVDSVLAFISFSTIAVSGYVLYKNQKKVEAAVVAS